MSSDRISPTAHYTGYTWARNGLSDPALATLEGRVLFESMKPLMTVMGVLGLPTLEPYLLARHRKIDEQLGRAIDAGTVTQVIEIAAGMSGRGLRFTRRYGDQITYIEADLPAMAARKLATLEGLGPLAPQHRVEPFDALRTRGEGSLRALANQLDPRGGVAVITEGLLPYLDKASVLSLWSRIASESKRFPSGLYLADIHLSQDDDLLTKGFRLALSGFVRGGVHAHFNDEPDTLAALTKAGFSSVKIEQPEKLVHIIEASTTHPA